MCEVADSARGARGAAAETNRDNLRSSLVYQNDKKQYSALESEIRVSCRSNVLCITDVVRD
jgi:hypothetical protein